MKDEPRPIPAASLLPIAASLVMFVLFCGHIGPIADGQTMRLVIDWVPALGISLSFLIDGLSLTFSLLITGIGVAVFLYARTYMAGYPQFGRFMAFLFSFMIAMLGLVLADNLMALFVFWELTTLTSYLLIGFNHTGPQARRSALQALFVTGVGALALLAGLILLGLAAGSFQLSEIRQMGAQMGGGVQGHSLYIPILILILAGAFTKSAQFPVHFWLPNAMAAPTPVSAFLHSATMVKAGVYLMARLHPTLSGTDGWFWTLTIVGGLTALYASVLALRQTDLKQILAYTTLMALGTLTLLLGQDSAYAITAFFAFLIVHCLYKAALFLIVGGIERATGTRDLTALDGHGGLSRALPFSAVAAALAALSMAGIPPLLGFISKELQYAGLAALGPQGLIFMAMMVAANALMVAAAGQVALRPFWGRGGNAPAMTKHRLGNEHWSLILGPLTLGILGLIFGLMPGLLQGPLMAPSVAALLGQGGTAKQLTLWAGVNLPLVLSGVTLALGAGIYLAHGRIWAWLGWADDVAAGFDRGWDRFLAGLAALATGVTRVVQPGVLRTYMAVIFATALAGIVGALIVRDAWPAIPSFAGLTWPIVALSMLICVGAILAAITSSRVVAMAGLGVVGIAVALIFIVFSAPDVAITQLLVETLIVVLVSVALLRLPLLDQGGRDVRWRDAALALGLGAAVTTVLLAVLATPLDLRLTPFFETASWPQAFGRNIVNVILVDFRALDTFGEIAVVVIAALSAYALLRTTAKKPHQKPDQNTKVEAK